VLGSVPIKNDVGRRTIAGNTDFGCPSLDYKMNGLEFIKDMMFKLY